MSAGEMRVKSKSSELTCRSCGSNSCCEVLDLGDQPLANGLLAAPQLDEPERKHPLKLMVCQDCWMMQISEIIHPEALFSDYVYFSSVSDAVLLHAKKNVDDRIREASLDSNSLVIEIASNDGYLLKNYVKAGIPCLGIEPALNVAEVARKNESIETITEFFGEKLGRQLANQGRLADIVHANNVFAHVPDINDFVAGIKLILKPSGCVVFEFPYGKDLIDHLEFDTIYHEHVFYFTLTALIPLFARHGLECFRVEKLKIHVGSLRLFVSHKGVFAEEESVRDLKETETLGNITNMSFYEGFSQQVESIRADLNEIFANIRMQGKSIAAYGASAKGSTLLNYVSPQHGTLKYIVDRSSAKTGLYSPGLHLPIVEVAQLLEDQPDYTLLLTWNFKDEIFSQQKDYRSRGGKFIVPIPSVIVE